MKKKYLMSAFMMAVLVLAMTGCEKNVKRIGIRSQFKSGYKKKESGIKGEKQIQF